MGGWAAIFIHIYVRVPLNGMCKFSVSKIKNNVFNASHQKPEYFVWITKPFAFVQHMIKFVEEYVKNNKQTKKYSSISNPRFRLFKPQN